MKMTEKISNDDLEDGDETEYFEEENFCPRCGAPDGGTGCGLPNCGLVVGDFDDE